MKFKVRKSSGIGHLLIEDFSDGTLCSGSSEMALIHDHASAFAVLQRMRFRTLVAKPEVPHGMRIRRLVTLGMTLMKPKKAPFSEVKR